MGIDASVSPSVFSFSRGTGTSTSTEVESSASAAERQVDRGEAQALLDERRQLVVGHDRQADVDPGREVRLDTAGRVDGRRGEPADRGQGEKRVGGGEPGQRARGAGLEHVLEVPRVLPVEGCAEGVRDESEAQGVLALAPRVASDEVGVDPLDHAPIQRHHRHGQRSGGRECAGGCPLHEDLPRTRARRRPQSESFPPPL